MATLAFRVVPNARENRVAGQYGNAIKIRLKAKPIEGAANEALCRFIAERLGIPERRVRLCSGDKSRQKMVTIEGVDEKTAQSRLLT